MPADPLVATLFPSPETALALLVGLVLGAVLGSLVTARIQARLNLRLHDRFEALSALALDRTSERFLNLAGERLGSLGGVAAVRGGRQ